MEDNNNIKDEKNNESFINNNIIQDKSDTIKNNRKNNFLFFIENYFGYFKQYMTEKELLEICKTNKKTMSLSIIDLGNNLYKKKEEKKNKLKQIIKQKSVSNIKFIFYF